MPAAGGWLLQRHIRSPRVVNIFHFVTHLFCQYLKGHLQVVTICTYIHIFEYNTYISISLQLSKSDERLDFVRQQNITVRNIKKRCAARSIYLCMTNTSLCLKSFVLFLLLNVELIVNVFVVR